MLPSESVTGQGPPPAVRRLIRAARRRYWRLPLTRRPALTDPRSYMGLFTGADLVALAAADYWPLPAEALAMIAVTPAERNRQRREVERRVETVLARIFARDARAVRSLLFPSRNGVKR